MTKPQSQKEEGEFLFRHAFFSKLLEQQPGCEPNTPITKLDVAMATGNNATLFDKGGGTDRALAPPKAALALLTFQCFSPGGRIGVAHWAGKPTGSGSSDHAPCISRNMLHTYLRGGDLGATVHLNLLHKKQVGELTTWGYPVWERLPESQAGTDRVQNATETYLGRLVPVSRAIRLSPDSEWILNSNGLAYPHQREPASTEVLRQKSKGTQRTILRLPCLDAEGFVGWRTFTRFSTHGAPATSRTTILWLPGANMFNLDDCVFPTRVGMVRSQAWDCAAVDRFPHTRGDGLASRTST